MAGAQRWDNSGQPRGDVVVAATFSYDGSVIRDLGQTVWGLRARVRSRRAYERDTLMAPASRASFILSAIIAVVMAVAGGCANNQNDPSTQLGPDGKGPITPGTQRDFAVNVG